ncbi:MAG: hypothetical protein R3C10_11830 [Pirellulales bacterium]
MLTALDAMIEMGHELVESLQLRAHVYVREFQKPLDALIDLNRAGQLDPDDGETYRLLALAHLALGNGYEARRDLQLYLESEPHHMGYDPFNVISVVENLDDDHELVVQAIGNGPRPIELRRFAMNYEGLLLVRKIAHDLAAGRRPTLLTDSSTCADAPIFAVSVRSDHGRDVSMIEWYFSHEHRLSEDITLRPHSEQRHSHQGPCGIRTCSLFCAPDSSTPLGAWKVHEVETWLQNYGDLAVENITRQFDAVNASSPQPLVAPTSTKSVTTQPTSVGRLYVSTSTTPTVLDTYPVEDAYQYVIITLHLYCRDCQDHEAAPNGPTVMAHFNGQLHIVLHWTTPTTPLIVAMALCGEWDGCEPTQSRDPDQVDDKVGARIDAQAHWAVRRLQDTYRGKNIRDMIPKLTSDLLPPPAAGEISSG